MARITDSPRGARAPGEIATVTLSISDQPAVRSSSTALERAGVELAPLAAKTPATLASASSASGKAATKSRASAKSR
jgi:hypothetical protein